MMHEMVIMAMMDCYSMSYSRDPCSYAPCGFPLGSLFGLY